jgi:hypothetical protein
MFINFWDAMCGRLHTIAPLSVYVTAIYGMKQVEERSSNE